MLDSTNHSLNKLLGLSYNYKGEDLVIERFKEISTGKICVYTHKSTLTFLESEIPEFLEFLREPKSSDFRDKDLMHINTRQLQGFTPSQENVEMKATLMEMLAKVKNNPAAIPQAKAVCDVVNTMVGIQKTEMEMLKMLKKN